MHLKSKQELNELVRAIQYIQLIRDIGKNGTQIFLLFLLQQVTCTKLSR